MHTYTYDANGNIVSDSLGGTLKHSYVYDEAGQLVRVNDAVQNRTFCYTYDNGGNLVNKKRYAYTTGTLGSVLQTTAAYAYSDSNWKDRLISFNSIPLSYDAIGNLTYFDGRSFTWSAGRQLEKYEISLYGYSIDYKYNADGLRTQKYIDDDQTYTQTTYDYIWADGKLVSQADGTDVLYFLYDSSDSPIGFVLNDSETYLYIKNLQGDITGIADENGAIIVNYTYDEWGKLLSTTGSEADTIGLMNPLRYRGYYYDTETGYYYLQSRYYNPSWGRFINADDAALIDGTGIFSYCGNNPVTLVDPTGYAKVTAIKVWRVTIGWNITLSSTEVNRLIGAITIGGGVSGLVPVLAGLLAFPELSSKVIAAVIVVIASAVAIYSGVLTYANAKGKGVRIRLNYVPYPPYAICTGVFSL